MTHHSDEREALCTTLLDEIWLLKTTLDALPRHREYSEDQFEAGFATECQGQWLQIVQRLDSISHQWQRLYPALDITQRPSYADVKGLMKDLLDGGKKWGPPTFKNELFKLASHFRTFQLCYFAKGDDPIIQQKLASMIKSLTQVADNYIEDWNNASMNQTVSTQDPL